jgi:hypothetical protein
MTTYTGRVDIAVNPGEVTAFPESLDKFAIHRENEHETIIDVRVGMRKWWLL